MFDPIGIEIRASASKSSVKPSSTPESNADRFACRSVRVIAAVPAVPAPVPAVCPIGAVVCAVGASRSAFPFAVGNTIGR